MADTTNTDADGLYGTSLTLSWIENKLQSVLKTSAKFGANVKTERIGFGQGFLSVMVHLIADWTLFDEMLPKSFVVKIPSTLSFREINKVTKMGEKMDEINKASNNENVDMEKMFDEFEKIIQMVCF
jgi:hypothetical protein